MSAITIARDVVPFGVLTMVVCSHRGAERLAHQQQRRAVLAMRERDGLFGIARQTLFAKRAALGVALAPHYSDDAPDRRGQPGRDRDRP